MNQRMVRATQFNSCCAKLSTSFLLSYGPNRPDLNSTDLGSLKQHAYELQVNKIEKIKQRLVELLKNKNNNI